MEGNSLPRAGKGNSTSATNEKNICLPNEILLNIVKCFRGYEPAYKIIYMSKLRLVDKTFCAFATPYLFENVHIYARDGRTCDQIRGLVAYDLAKHIRHAEIDISYVSPPAERQCRHGQYTECFFESLKPFFAVFSEIPLPQLTLVMGGLSRQPPRTGDAAVQVSPGQSAELLLDFMSESLSSCNFRVLEVAIVTGSFTMIDQLLNASAISSAKKIQFRYKRQPECPSYPGEEELPFEQDIECLFNKTLPRSECQHLTVDGMFTYRVVEIQPGPILPSRLRYICLFTMNLDSTLFIQLLRGTINLDHLELTNIQLGDRKHPWKDVFDQLAVMAALQSVKFETLFDNFPRWLIERASAGRPERFGGDHIPVSHRPLDVQDVASYSAFERLLRILTSKCKDEGKKQVMESYLKPEFLCPEPGGILIRAFGRI